MTKGVSRDDAVKVGIALIFLSILSIYVCRVRIRAMVFNATFN
jgi:hypothetical protein